MARTMPMVLRSSLPCKSSSGSNWNSEGVRWRLLWWTMRKKFQPRIKAVIVSWLGVLGLAASEHRGQVKFGGLPVPGATVIATQGEKKFTAISGEQGSYSFPNLPDGVWTIQVEMLCFSPIKQEVTAAPDAPASEWDLKLLPFEEIKAAAG